MPVDFLPGHSHSGIGAGVFIRNLKRGAIESGSESFGKAFERYIYHEVAVEVKSTEMATPGHIKGLQSFGEEYSVKELILLTNDLRPGKMGNVSIYPWRVFLERLWAGEIIS